MVIGFFVIGLRHFVDLDTPPAEADVVDVEASQWQFNFKYPNGAVSDELYLRSRSAGGPAAHSQDVLHALYIPAFRVQRNAVPGRTTEMWFTARRGWAPTTSSARSTAATATRR